MSYFDHTPIVTMDEYENQRKSIMISIHKYNKHYHIPKDIDKEDIVTVIQNTKQSVTILEVIHTLEKYKSKAANVVHSIIELSNS